MEHAADRLTRWGRLEEDHLPLNEYPRPQFMRPEWLNLNGIWEYGVSPQDQIPEKLEGSILVPFSPEAPLSGADRSPGTGEKAWYARSFSLPEGFFKGRLLLNFGAVDQICQIYVNGHLAGEHAGGYTPFTVDITQFALKAGNNRLLVSAEDRTELGTGSYGKQSTNPGGIWYTAQSGIWQTVWLESVPEEYISELRIIPDTEEKRVLLEIPAGGGTDYAVFADGKRICTGSFSPEGKAEISLPDCILWTPENPFLYDILLKRGKDLVKSYFAMRSVRRDGNRLLLNGKPIRLSGLLDQGYWPDGLYTAPSDEAMIFDIETAKEMGFNLLRKHVKVEPLRWYYHCDRLGMLVWQDIPNGGDSYSPFWTRDVPLTLGMQLKDRKYGRFGRKYEPGRKRFEEELADIVHTLQACPSVIVWTLFNEGWGQFDTRRLTDRLRELDPTRLIDAASGWHDQGGGDFCSRHIYFQKLKFSPENSRIGAITECGGYGLDLSGKGGSFSYRKAKDKAGLEKLLTKLYRGELLPLKSQGLDCCIYTQLSDVEQERNGLLTADRETVKIDTAQMRKLNQAWLEDSPQ